MKIRSGFVSNSSSSSFVVIASHTYDIDSLKRSNRLTENLTVDGCVGTVEFGWQNDTYYDFHSKLNFAYLQYREVMEDHPEWLSMIEDALGDELDITNIEWDMLDKNGSLKGYIDHQSSAREGANTEIFDSLDSLKQFLFNPSSYIRTGNDNDM